MYKFKQGFVFEFLMRDYLGLSFIVDGFDELYSFVPSSWVDSCVLNLNYNAF